MREILFRGKAKAGYKRIAEGEWIEGSLFYSDNENGTVCQIATSYLSAIKDESVMVVAYEVDPETVCQYTGLTDKNGRKIFEGDIIQYGKKKYFVVWLDSIASFIAKPLLENERCSPCMNDGTMKEVEIIGNIFDNIGSM